MFGNLIESGSHKDDRARKSSFFLGTLAVYTLAFLAIGVGSIYAYNTHVEYRDLRLVSMVMPTDLPEAQTPQRRNTSGPSNGGNSSSRILVVRTPPLITRIDPTLVRENMPVAPHALELPEGTIFRIGVPGPGDNIFGGTEDKAGSGPGNNDAGGNSNRMDELVKTTPPPPMKVETSKPPTTKPVKSIGVVNGIATYLPKPAYTPIAKAAHAFGTVTVQVLIDETGKVVSARALSGHPLLTSESIKAAYQARFTPTFLSHEPVKVSGIITYNFVLQ
jgi:hypothetical protein